MNICLEAKDGCSGFISYGIIKLTGKPPKFEACCDLHDKPYENGGPLSERKKADIALRECVRKAGYPIICWIIYFGVRIGGHPYIQFPTMKFVDGKWHWCWTGARWGWKKYKWPKFQEG